MAIAEDYNFESLNITSGNLEVRLAENSLEIDAAQSLRYDYEGLLCMADCSIFSMLRFQDDGKMLT